MTRILKRFVWLLVVTGGLRSALGFSLMGPVNEAYQVPVIGYNLGGIDIGAPKNLGEEFRWTTPTNYYAFDATFLDYFGSNGVVAVDQAIAIVNGVGNLSAYSQDLSEVPLEARRINYRAASLHLLDLKSVALFHLTEELGLIDSIRFTWTLRSRDCPSCPTCSYNVIRRNFDPATFEPSSYVNNVLYTYFIFEICTGNDPLADAIDFSVDPLAPSFSPISWIDGFLGEYGVYYTGLTRDDVGGLRYLMRTNNVNFEGTSSDSVFFQTNTTSQLLFTSNLTLFAAQALTNDANAIAALYPGLIVTSTTNTFTNVYTTNVTAYFTNFPFDPIGTPPHVAFRTNVTVSTQTLFHHTFQNLVIVQNVNGTFVPTPTNQIPAAGRAFVTTVTTNSDSTVTNVTSKTYLTNINFGEFFILASNVCDQVILAVQLTNVVPSSNVVLIATNTANGTNEQLFSQTLVTYFTNHVFVTFQVNCVTNTVALRQGMDHIKFIKTSFDSLLGRFFQPITNVYYLLEVTNSAIRTNWFRRVVTAPNVLFSARDLSPSISERTDTASNFRTNNELPALAGPGNIEPNMQITFEKVGPLIFNAFDPIFFNALPTERTSITNFIWGSFDGSTNAPIVYPQGTSIMNLEDQVLFRVVTTLPDATVDTPYSAQVAAGGQQPYNVSTTGALPPDLVLNPDGSVTGTPTVPGTFSFDVTVTDSNFPTPLSRSGTVTITINP